MVHYCVIRTVILVCLLFDSKWTRKDDVFYGFQPSIFTLLNHPMLRKFDVLLFLYKMDTKIDINLPHHTKEDLCTTRPAYRQGRKLTSVKVYTVNRESQHLLIYNVPAVNLDSELHKVCQRFGEITYFIRVPAHEVEDFTCVYHVQYSKVHHARVAKRKMDDMSFFGGILHVCYAPELETVEETKEKLSTRRKEVSFHLKKIAFPQLFRAERKGRLKRKAPNSFEVPSSFSTSYGTTSTSINEVNNHQTQDYSTPGPSESSQMKLPPIDITPYKKLVPTKVSRIVFHNKT